MQEDVFSFIESGQLLMTSGMASLLLVFLTVVSC